MNKSLLTTASIAAMLAASPAMADPAPPENASTIVQTGSGTHADVTQTDGGSTSDIDQNGDGIGTFVGGPNAGKKLVATVVQDGYDSTSTIVQTGTRNDAQLTQNYFAEGMRSSITQSNTDNIATVDQVGIGGDETTGSFITQEGEHGIATVLQDYESDGATSTITQSGDRATASVAQYWGASTSTITQSGDDTNAEVEQSGEVSSTIEQSGSYAEAVVLQDGERSSSTIFQRGAGTAQASGAAFVVQVGDDHKATINQLGNAGALIAQTGNSNVASTRQTAAADGAASAILQDGERNNANVLQEFAAGSNVEQGLQDISSADNIAVVRQRGADTLSDITMDGQRNTTNITQRSTASDSFAYTHATDDSSITVAQRGDNSASVVFQYVAEETGEVLSTGNHVVVRQVGADTHSYVAQSGNSNSVDVTLDGTGDANVRYETAQGYKNVRAESEIWQIGDNNSAIVEQIADSANARIYQGTGYSFGAGEGPLSGTGNTGTIRQRLGADDSFADIRTDGTNNMATVLQSASNSTVYINQDSSGNTALVDQQSGSNLTATITQYADNNNATITQVGMDNTATINQLTAGNSMTINQSGIGNTMTVNQ